MIEHRRSEPIAALACAALAVLVYLNALGNGWAYDDVVIVTGNPLLRSPSHVLELLAAPYWRDPELMLYRPVTSLSFALDWWIAGNSAVWFHGVNVFWHAAATFTACMLLAQLLPLGAAAAGAAIFAVHPVHVEAVANVVGRAELLAGAATFAAGWAWLRWNGRRSATAVALLYAFAVLAKESALILPGLLILLDVAAGRYRAEGIRSRLRADAGSAIALVGVAVFCLALRFGVLGGITPGRLDPALEVAGGTGDRLWTALQAWPHYARLLFFPRTLLADYGPRVLMPLDGPTPFALAGIAILAALLAGGVVAWHRGRTRLALALLWFPIAILPAANLIAPIGVVVAERVLYVPSFALSLVVGLVAEHLLVRRRHRIAVPALAAGATIVVLLAARTWSRTPEWATTETVMAALVRDRPDSFRGHWVMARAAELEGRVATAARHYDTAWRLWPHRQTLTMEAAAFASRHGHIAELRERAAFAARRWPGDLDAQRLLAGVALDMGQDSAAGQAIARGLTIDSTDAVLRAMRVELERRRSSP